MAPFNTFEQGQRLGLWGGIPGYGQSQGFGTLNLESMPGFSSLPQAKQNELRQRAIESGIEAQSTLQTISPLLPKQYSLEELEAAEERRARRAQEIGKESLQEGFKYAMMAGIPKTIAQSFGNIASMQVLGARNATDALAATLASYPRPNFTSINFQPQKYLS